MTEAQVTAQLTAEFIAGATGSLTTTSEIVAFSGIIGMIATFFFVIVWVGVPIIERFVNFLYKCVDKLYDFWH